MRLEDLRPRCGVQGVHPDGAVTVVSLQWFGSEALELTNKTPGGAVANELLYRHDEDRLEVVAEGRPWSFDGRRRPVPARTRNWFLENGGIQEESRGRTEHQEPAG